MELSFFVGAKKQKFTLKVGDDEITAILEKLSAAEGETIKLLLGVGENNVPMSTKRVAEIRGVSRRRVLALKASAMQKIVSSLLRTRDAMYEEVLDAYIGTG